MGEDDVLYISEFVLLGLTDDPTLQTILFALFLLMYIITLLGSGVIITVIRLSPRLHTPMYFFLSHLSFVDLCYSSTITPKMLTGFLSERNTISLLGCGIQLYFYSGFGSTECILLAVMAYDRYVAICNPLLYTVIMTKKVCIQLVILVYGGGFLNALIQTIFTFQLSFCGSNVINHFACDFPPLLILSCTDTFINELMIFVLAGFLTISSVLVILISYTYILSNILKIQYAEGRHKAFSTCGSHLTCVTLYFGTIFFMYLRPRSSYSQEQDKVITVFYTVVISMLNPLIYSLRNQDVKQALRKMMSSIVKQLML
ncbi:olfactory receptor 1020-like isoform X2 [Microcaecilia unicolor]|uniref:Olfactory receptor n=1 Tax=Microcaecilia unicolor TaxID=1415580 RepID=A0A6P7ZUM1_9AMPH|nr:olfactory receptor 1020-like isoform X2 [Microcaecilia unicolor]